jgi:hypothetical protein
MEIYGSGSFRNIDNPANILALKSDLHTCFDKRWFAVVPRAIAEAETPSPTQYITHILLKEAAELWPTYHNTLVQYLHEDSEPYIFARFAWAVLFNVKCFIVAGFPRRVIRIQANNEGRTEHKEEYLSGPQLKALYGGGGSQRATPMKRRSLGGSVADDDLAGSSNDEGDGDADMINEWDDTTGVLN